MVLALSVETAPALKVSVEVDPDSVVRCIREDIVGSLARTRRVCHNVGEWRNINRDADAELQRVIRESMNRPKSN